MDNKLVIKKTETEQMYIDWEQLMVDQKDLLSNLINKHMPVTTSFCEPTPGYQIIYLSDMATPEMLTGLSPLEVMTYNIILDIDGKRFHVKFPGSQCQTFKDLLNSLNNSVLKDVVNFQLTNGNIYIISKTVGKSSSVRLAGGNLFNSITIFKYPIIPVAGSLDLMDMMSSNNAPNGALFIQLINYNKEPINNTIEVITQSTVPVVIEPVVESVVETTVVEVNDEPVVEPTIDVAEKQASIKNKKFNK